MDRFWIRQAEVIVGGKRFHSDELDIDFEVPFDNDDEPDIANITMYNLSENSINSIKKEQNVILNAGYNGDVGTIFMGTIQKIHTRWDGVDKVTPKGRVINAMVKDAVKLIVNECNSQFNISKAKIIILPAAAGIHIGFLLNSDTGLIGSPEPFEKEEEGKTIKGYKIQMLSNHKITVNSIIQVESKTANGIYRVVQGKHSSNFITDAEVLE